MTKLGFVAAALILSSLLAGMTETPRADAVPVCIATPMASASSIEPCHLRARSARSISSGAMDAVAKMFKMIHLSQRGPILGIEWPACTPGAWEGISNWSALVTGSAGRFATRSGC